MEGIFTESKFLAVSWTYPLLLGNIHESLENLNFPISEIVIPGKFLLLLGKNRLVQSLHFHWKENFFIFSKISIHCTWFSSAVYIQ